MKYQIGVIGSSDEEAVGKEKVFTLGGQVAELGCTLLTGGCTGIPYAAVIGAKEKNGLTVGISPASDREEHIEVYEYPVENHDIMIYTGFGYKGRNVVLVRSCDAVIAAAGRMGTLNELTIAYSHERVIGLLNGIPGASDVFEEIAQKLGRPGREIVVSEKPEELLQEVLGRIGKE